ncbi:CIC11C00000000374 [Sungouiella intermedia]|uniref:CIC11C00000000374 n=1 Tax=Sungouiella intermedia TaxID=45354 RepID=A0A1L0BJC0_9ASCO|nr:CIC11C00000000374 [[Candida] intermedia]
MPSSKTTATRRKHTNLKLGCLNCKRKKIRCDENLPQCENCLRAKKEICSYLTMNQADINRIKLTHSLRNSQNKLLSRDYRLPISTNHYFGNSSDGKIESPVTTANTLEFQFEFCDFDMPFPKVPYLAFQFHNTFLDAYRQGYDSDDDMTPSVVSTEDAAPRGLPHCRPLNSTFERLDYAALILKVAPQTQAISLMHFWEKFDGIGSFANVFIDSNILVGRAVISNAMRQKLEVVPDSDDYNLMVQCETKARQECPIVTNSLLRLIRTHVANFESNTSARELQYQYTLVSFASWNCTVALVFLNSPRALVAQIISDRCGIFIKFMRRVSSTEVSSSVLVKEFAVFAHSGLLYIHIPLYEPAFLFEMRNNLRTLESIMDERTIMMIDDKKSMDQLRRIRVYYYNLTSFLDNYVLNYVYATRNELYVTTYPPNMLFTTLQRWWTICPTELVADGITYEFPGFLDDIRSTIFLYFEALSIALDSVLPAAKYLFTLGFQWVSRKVVDAKRFRPNLELYRTDYVLPDRELANFLWRHNIYAMRLWTFFDKRLKLYRENTTFRCPFPDTMPSSQFGPRNIKNALELPIRNFNTLSIKQHNFAKKFTRTTICSSKTPPCVQYIPGMTKFQRLWCTVSR